MNHAANGLDAENQTPPSRPNSKLIRTSVSGLLMGIADVVPGVSGGTVALVMGIYERLVLAISRIDATLLQHLGQRRFKQAARHVDLSFLLNLIGGIALGFVVTVLTLSQLLQHPETRSFVQATFFGLVLGSTWIVFRMIDRKTPGARPHLVAILACATVAAIICWLPPLNDSGEPALWFVFLCGGLAICAMVLPGISGALILLLLGSYTYLIEVARSILHREDLNHDLPIAVVFSLGCVIGLVLFSKVLRYLLRHYHRTTLSGLCGLMIGSLFKLWPYQRDLTPNREEFKHKVFQPAWPDQIDARLLYLILVIVLAAIAVLVIERIARPNQVESRSARY